MDDLEFNRLMHDYLRSINGKLAQIMHKVFMPLSVSPQQCLLLKKLRETDEMTVSELAESMHTPLSNATNICNRLSESGYIEKLRDGADQRKVYVSLTEEGRRLAKSVESTISALMASLIGKVSEEDREEIIGGLKKLDDLMRTERLEEE